MIVRSVLGWTVAIIVSLASLGLGILAADLMSSGSDTVYVGGAMMGIIGGIAGGLWLKDKIVGVKNPGPPTLR